MLFVCVDHTCCRCCDIFFNLGRLDFWFSIKMKGFRF
jgi:hypothetical protein